MEEVNRLRWTALPDTAGRALLWRLSQSSSPHKCRFHLGFSIAESVESARESIEDGENILGKFGLGACVLVIENQDASSVLVCKPFDEFSVKHLPKPIPR